MRFILEERFILNEADATDNAEDIAEQDDSGDAEAYNDELDKEGQKDAEADAEADTDSNDKSSSSVDWDAYYEECRNDKQATQKFWHGDPQSANELKKAGYYKSVWGESAQFVQKLGTRFLDLLDDEGYTEDLNPVVACLQKVLKAYKSGIKLTDQTVGLLASKYDDNSLQEADFLGKGPFGMHNLIFRKAFYNATVSEQKQYLDLQQSIKNNSKASTWKLENASNFIFFGTDSVKNIVDQVSNKFNTEPATNPNRFRTAKELKYIQKRLNMNIQKEATPEEVKKLVEAIKQLSPEKARAALAYLAILNRKTLGRAVDAFLKQNSVIAKNLTFKYDPKEIATFDGLFKIKQLNLTDKGLTALLKALAIQGKFNLDEPAE